jgi:hypothetical protein
MGRGENVLLLFLPLAMKHWNLPLATKHWNLPLAIKHWNLPLATKHWNLPLATKLGSSFTSFLFLFFKKANSDHWGLSFF